MSVVFIITGLIGLGTKQVPMTEYCLQNTDLTVISFNPSLLGVSRVALSNYTWTARLCYKGSHQSPFKWPCMYWSELCLAEQSCWLLSQRQISVAGLFQPRGMRQAARSKQRERYVFCYFCCFMDAYLVACECNLLLFFFLVPCSVRDSFSGRDTACLSRYVWHDLLDLLTISWSLFGCFIQRLCLYWVVRQLYLSNGLFVVLLFLTVR